MYIALAKYQNSDQKKERRNKNTNLHTNVTKNANPLSNQNQKQQGQFSGTELQHVVNREDKVERQFQM